MRDGTASLEQAFDQLDAFRAIHEPGGVTPEAVRCLLEAVGFDDGTKALVRDRLYETETSRDGSATFLGLIIGLLAAELDPA
jgi:hypothetical protein